MQVIAEPPNVYSPDRSADWWITRNKLCGSIQGLRMLLYGSPDTTSARLKHQSLMFSPPPFGGINAIQPQNGWSRIVIPGV